MHFDATTVAWVLVIGEWVIRLAMVVVVPFRRTPDAAKAWLLLVFFEPWIGLALYLLIGRPRMPRWRREQLKRLPEVLVQFGRRCQFEPKVPRSELGPRVADSVGLTENLGHLPIVDGNSVEILTDYGCIVDRLVEDIDSARRNVHLLYYLFIADGTGSRIVEALERASSRGVRCRVLMDAHGSRSALKSLGPRMSAAGIELHAACSVGLFGRRILRPDLRNHRKIAVIDGSVGYTGSMNMVDPGFKQGIVYEELVIRVTGPVVLQLQSVFASDWFIETDESLDNEDVFPEPRHCGLTLAQCLPSGPDFPSLNNQKLFVTLFHSARQRIVITTPYFIPDEPLIQALETAVLRGVEVHLILSDRSDQRMVGLGQRSYYEDLLRAGVKIHLYRQNFLHAKHISIDDHVCVIGSSNMDIRSFVLNAEITMIVYDRDVAQNLRIEEQRYYRHCVTLDLDRWCERPLRTQMAEAVARLMSPLL
jgi:cardiolipin synthase